MNYIKHTVAAHEHLRRQPDARPQHLALYWTLFFAWNAEFFHQDGLTLNHEQVMSAARIGNRHTYRGALRDLDTWGLISYHPSKVRGTVSTCRLNVLDGFVRPEAAPQNQPCKARSGPTENPFVGPEVAQPLGPEMASQTGFVGPEVAQDSLLYQTSFQTVVPNVGGAPEKKERERFAGEGLSEVQVLDDNRRTAPATPSFDEPVPAPGAAPKTPRQKRGVAPGMRVKHSKGVGQKPLASTAAPTLDEPRRRGGRPQRPELPFAESELATYEAFAAAFAGSDYALADLRFYHEKILNWRQKGEVPRRRDWKATATQFFLNDVHDNRLKLAPSTQRHEPGVSHAAPVGSGIPATGYRSKRWD